VKEFQNYLSRIADMELDRTENVLVVDLCEKKLGHFKGGERVARYQVASSARPRSCGEGSLGTPWGLHAVAARHGANAAPGTVFKARVSTGRCWWELPDRGGGQACLVTTRILRLRGLEAGLNAGPGVDSYNRYIYIHGTNHPDRFPDNISAGCLLLRDDDLIELFDRVAEGAHVWISHPH
jgi:hypothetical protein